MNTNNAPTSLASAVQQIKQGMESGNITGLDEATLAALQKALQEQTAPRYFTVYLPGYDREKPATSELRFVVAARDEASIRRYLPFASMVREVFLDRLQPEDRERAERLARTDLAALPADAYARIARHAPRDGASDAISILATQLDALLQLAADGKAPTEEQVTQARASVTSTRASLQQYLVARAGLRILVDSGRAHEGGPTQEHFNALADRLQLYPQAA